MGKDNENKTSFPENFLTKIRKKVTPNDNLDDYSKIEEIKWNEDVLSGKSKIVGTMLHK